MLPGLVDVVRGEFERAASSAPDAREVDRAKAQLKAGLLMSLESSGSRVEQAARQLIAHNRLYSSGELVARVDAVTAEGIREFAASMFARPATAIVVGAGRKSAAHARRAAGLQVAATKPEVRRSR